MKIWMVLFFGWAVTGGAQGKLSHDRSSHSIVVTDQIGAAIAQARVQTVSMATGDIRMLTTDATGVAHWTATPCAYLVTASLPGFLSQTKTIEFDNNEGSGAGIVLQIDPTPALDPCPCVEEVLITDTETEHSTQLLQEPTIPPARPIPTGLAPGMQVKLVSEKGGEKVYAVIFAKGDEVLSGLTDFAIQYKVEAAHFTGIGAVSGATVGWLDLAAKAYRPIHVDQQVEVLSMMGDVATFNGKPVVHAHMVFGRQDGSTVGGHLWEAHVNPTLEVFVSVDPVGLKKKQDADSGMKLIDPAR